MSHEDKQIQSDVGCDEPFKQHVFYCISYIIAKCSLMQELFHKWLSLTLKLQSLLNYEACYILDKNEMAIFLGIIKGMIFWNTVQDSEGACGYHKNPLEFRFDKEQEKRILKIIVDTKRIVRTMNAKAGLCNELLKYKVCYHNRKLVFIKIPNCGDV